MKGEGGREGGEGARRPWRRGRQAGKFMTHPSHATLSRDSPRAGEIFPSPSWRQAEATAQRVQGPGAEGVRTRVSGDGDRGNETEMETAMTGG